MIAIEDRCKHRDTWAFVTSENVDMLAEKLVGIVGDRRLTKVRRHLGESAGIPEVRAGLRVDRGAYGEGVNRHPGRSVGIYLAGSSYRLEAVSFHIGMVTEPGTSMGETIGAVLLELMLANEVDS